MLQAHEKERNYFYVKGGQRQWTEKRQHLNQELKIFDQAEKIEQIFAKAAQVHVQL